MNIAKNRERKLIMFEIWERDSVCGYIYNYTNLIKPTLFTMGMNGALARTSCHVKLTGVSDLELCEMFMYLK
jgi:hypothetical protein